MNVRIEGVKILARDVGHVLGQEGSLIAVPRRGLVHLKTIRGYFGSYIAKRSVRSYTYDKELTVNLQGIANEGRESVEQLAGCIRRRDLLKSAKSTSTCIVLTTNHQGYCSSASKIAINVSPLIGSSSPPVPAFALLATEFPGTINVGILLGMLAIDGEAVVLLDPEPD